MKRFLPLLLVALFTVPAFSQTTTYNGTLDVTDPTYNRPEPGTPPTTVSPTATNVYYDVIPILITTPGFITITSSSSLDNFGVLYGPGGFDPTSPLNNALVANDDQSGTNFGFTYNFTVPGVYYLVVSFYKNVVTGPYAVTLSPVTTVPVKLVSFTAEKKSAVSNLVKWSTAEELSVERYQVQRSTDGKNFTDLSGASQLARNSSVNTTYDFTDGAPVAGLNFYRIKIFEKNGHFTQSNVAVVNNKRSSSAIIKVFPNPAVDFLYVETKATAAGKAIISIVNAAGETMSSKEYILNNQPVFTLDVRTLARGKYFVKTVIDNEQTISTFIKN